MKMWANSAASVDRANGEGPPPCCGTAIVSSDSLIFVGDLPVIVAALRASRPDLAGIADAELWICGSCRERAFRHKHITRETWCRSHGLNLAIVADAWVHDEEFWGRGLTSAPAEAKAQPWWPAYVQAAHTPDDAGPGSSRAKFRGRVKLALRTFPTVLIEEVSLAPTGATQAVAIGAVAETPPDPLAGIDLTTPDVSIKP